MSDVRFAPSGYLWVCHACGKTHTDQYGIEGNGSPGWDATCALNSEIYPIARLRLEGQRVTEILPKREGK